jgi:type VI protein secretion system component Hcp
MKKVFHFLFVVAGVFFYTNCLAQDHIYIKAVGIKNAGAGLGTFDGGSQSIRHKNEIEATAYSDGMTGCANITGAGGGGACKVTKSPFTFSMGLSNATISFKYNMLIGRLLNSVDMVIGNSNGESGEFEYYKVHMENVFVVSVTEGATSSFPSISGPSYPSPTFNIELMPEQIAWQVANQNPIGGTPDKFSFGWDFLRNRSFSYSFP